jgi:hypothetical protein
MDALLVIIFKVSIHCPVKGLWYKNGTVYDLKIKNIFTFADRVRCLFVNLMVSNIVYVGELLMVGGAFPGSVGVLHALLH